MKVEDAFCEVRDPAVVRALLRELLTPAELAALRRRWMIVRLLQEGVSQRCIATRLRCSLCNVTRGARMLKKTRCVSRDLLAGISQGIGK